MTFRIRLLLVLPLIFSLVLLASCNNEVQNPSDQNVKNLYKGNKPIKPLAQYTAENSREWQNIAHEHIPKVSKSINKGEPALLIEVPLKNANMSHYIEKIGIMDEKGKDIMVVAIKRQNNPKTFAYFAIAKLPRNKKLKAFAKCNLHDLWTTPIDPKLLQYF